MDNQAQRELLGIGIVTAPIILVFLYYFIKELHRDNVLRTIIMKADCQG